MSLKPINLTKPTSSNKWRAMVTCVILPAFLGACSILPDGRSSSASKPNFSSKRQVAKAPPSARQCLADLGRANVRYTPLPDKYFGGGCKQINSVKLLNVGTPVTGLGPITCPLARNFAGWTKFAVQRAARQILGSELVRIETFGTYNCRSIAGSRKISQHAHANAIDISAFVLADGRRISVKNNWNGNRNERKFMRVIHGSACKRFGTVLSPNYNAAHRDHLHFDMSGSGFCA